MDPDQVRVFVSRRRAPETAGVLAVALDCSVEWRRIGTQACACGCGSFRAVFKHLPSHQFVGLEVDHDSGSPRDAVPQRCWAAWAWER